MTLSKNACHPMILLPVMLSGVAAAQAVAAAHNAVRTQPSMLTGGNLQGLTVNKANQGHPEKLPGSPRFVAPAAVQRPAHKQSFSLHSDEVHRRTLLGLALSLAALVEEPDKAEAKQPQQVRWSCCTVAYSWLFIKTSLCCPTSLFKSTMTQPRACSPAPRRFWTCKTLLSQRMSDC